jgi:hypothetical protein
MPIILDGSTGITVGTAVTIGTSDIKVGTATTISTTNISINNPIIIGSATSTGTASQPLQVTGGAYVSGNFGVGRTNPGTFLEVNGTGTEQFRILGSGGGYFFAGYDNTNNRARIGSFKTGWTDLSINEGGGNVGIGTTNPDSKLTIQDGGINVKNTTGNSFLVLDSGIGNAAGNQVSFIDFKFNGSLKANIAINESFSTPPLEINSAVSNNIIMATGGGNIGIGLTNPGRKLDVASDASTPLTGGSQIGVINSSTSASTYTGISLNGTDSTSIGRHGASISMLKDGTWTGGSGSYPGHLVLATRPSSGDQVERARITSGGYFKASNDGTYRNTAGSFHEFRQTAATDSIAVSSTNASQVGSSVAAIVSRAANSAYNFYYGGSNDAVSLDSEFILRGDGNGLCDGAWTGGGADYAEYFEWSDGNPDEEDRRGISVVLDVDKIHPAEDGEDPIGVISGNPSVVGDGAWNKWSGKYLRDDFGTYILEDYDVLQWTDEDGNEHAVDADSPEAADVPEDATVLVQQRRKLNPDYDPDQEYISREQRPEWDCVGLMGKLRIRKGQPIGSRWIKMRDISDSVEEWLVR